MGKNSGLAFPFRLADESASNESLLIPAIKQWRPYAIKDLPKISLLIVPSSFELFGNIDVEEVLETSGQTVVMENVNDELIAAICLRNYPNIPALLPDVWQDWMLRHYRLNDVTYDNTLFVHLLVWDRRYGWEFLSFILKSQFLNSFKLQNIVLVAPPKCRIVDHMDDSLLHKCFTKVLPVGQRIYQECQSLFIAFRHHVLPPMKIRRAVAEDNDDLVDIVDKTSPKLRETYGDFYIAEIVLNKPSSRDIIVVENNSVAIGMLSFNTNVSLQKLLLNFEVLPFHGFRKVSSADEFQSKAYGSQDSKTYNIPVVHLNQFTSDVLWNEDSLNFIVEESDLSKNTLKSQGSSDEYRAILQMLQQQISSSESSSNVSVNSIDQEISVVPGLSSEQFTSNEDEKHRIHSARIANLFETNLHITESDIFIIELYALDSDYDERLAYILLEASFECYPHLNYCAIALPSRLRFFPLLRHFVKVVVRSFRGRHVKQSLYVVHKNALLSCLTVRPATVADEANIRLYIETIYRGNYYAGEMMAAIERSTIGAFNSSSVPIYPFVVMTDNVVVGIIIVESYNKLDLLRLYYDVDSHVTSKYQRKFDQTARIRCCIIHPAFLPRFSFIFAELFRQTGFGCCFYKLKHCTRKELVGNNVMCEMIPIRPRRRLTYMQKFIDDQRTMGFKGIVSPFSLYHISVKSCEVRKVNVNKKIIVIGCSTVAIAFLEQLLFSNETKHIWFTHITLIAPHGLSPFLNESTGNVFETGYTTDYIKRLSLPTWVNVVVGRVTQINRHAKVVMVNDIKEVHYDRMYLFCGRQFDYPLKVVPLQKKPNNVLFINSVLDVDEFLMKLHMLKQTNKTYNIIVYGECHRSYACLNILLRSGTDPNKIMFVRPAIPIPSLFNDPFVAEETENLLKRSKIKVINNYSFASWKLNDDSDVTSVSVQSESCLQQIQCSLLLVFEMLIVSRSTIKVLNNAGLVFDGRLVIDQYCRTNDPYVHAAGPMTKYKRLLYADKYRHEFFDSVEIGQRLGQQLASEVDPLRPFGTSLKDCTLQGVVHRYQQPLVEYCSFPGNRYYLCIRTPGVQVAYNFAKSFRDYGVDIVTGGGDPDRLPFALDYFRIHLNQYNNVANIVCFAKKPIDVQRYVQLWGKHETLLGNLRHRFELFQIKCLYEYFDQSWACALYHDRFPLLDNANSNVLKMHDYAGYAMVEDISQKLKDNNFKKLSHEQRDEILKKYSQSAYEERVRANLMKFVMDHSDELPMYYAQCG